MYKNFLKRFFDFLVSITLVFIFFPIYLIIYLILFFQNGNPLFIQSRPGKNEKPFNLYKFKTMNDKKDNNGNLLPDKERITKFGSFLRKTSLDELPQLFNVLKGDMSLVGPRPLLFKYLPLYNERQKKRHTVRPGITGWAQINGRNSISWKAKFELDIYYVENLSFLLDMKILFLTLLKVFKREDVNQSSERPMLPFDGTN